jgi:hypothetical protein
MKVASIARLAPLALLCTGCNHCAPGRPPRRQGAALAGRADAAAGPDAARDAGSESLPPLMRDGCWSGLAPAADAPALLSALARRCAAGMQPVFSAPRAVTLENGRSRELSFSVDDPSKCLRAAAVSSEHASRLELRLLDASGREFARALGDGQFSLLMPRGPVCVDGRGTYRVVVSARGKSVAALVQVWRAE